MGRQHSLSDTAIRKANGWTRDLSGAVRSRLRKFGSRGSREPARRGNAFRGRHRRCGGGSGVEVVGSHRRDIDVLRQAADLLDELAAAGKFGEVAGSMRACL
jgi:hypothetical protein